MGAVHERGVDDTCRSHGGSDGDEPIAKAVRGYRAGCMSRKHVGEQGVQGG